MFLSKLSIKTIGQTTAMRNSLRCTTSVMPKHQARYFSQETPAEEKQPVAEPTAEEKAANAQEWGIKYDDECLKFEKEW